MIDFARISVKAGDGGDGAGSFRHIKGKRRGKADGGSGGDGGNVYIEASEDLNTLEPYRFVKDYFAKDGRRGFSNLQKGAQGEDLILKVPVGTQIRLSGISKPDDPMTGLPDNLPIFDLVENGQKIFVARGGAGGRGNAYLRDEYGRRPFAGQKGELGELANLTLELKLIADIGLIGLPNSGKSTLLAKLTAARPAIAPYPFTTLEPNLGVLRTPGRQAIRSSGDQVMDIDNKTRLPDSPIARLPRQLVLADIPGLIEGASKGKGLGDLFLRHIERTKLLLHLVDLSTNSDRQSDYKIIRNELKTYSKELMKKKEVIVFTKLDLVSKSEAESVAKLFKAKKKRVVLISSVTKEGLKELVELLFDIKKAYL